MRRDDIEIRAVLDSSAMLSYARGNVHVGELLVDIADEGAYTGLPTVALLEAYTQVGADRPARARLGVLATLPGVQVLPLGSGETAEVAHRPPRQGRPGPSARGAGGAEYDAHYLASEPHLTPSVIAPELVRHIPTDDA